MQPQNEKELKEAARLMLLRVIELNGGSVHRGAINKAIHELHDQGLIKEKFTPETPKNYTEYDFLLTDKGQGVLDQHKEAQVKKLEVKEIKQKKARPTVIEYKGETYILQPQHVGKGAKK